MEPFRIEKRILIAAYNVVNVLRAKYPGRTVAPEVLVEHDTFYYFGNRGFVRRGQMSEGKVLCIDTGFGPASEPYKRRRLLG